MPLTTGQRAHPRPLAALPRPRPIILPPEVIRTRIRGGGHYITTTPFYDALVTALMLRKGINRSEAYRQLLDDATGRGGHRSEAMKFAADQIIDRAETIAARHAELVQEMGKIIAAAGKIRSLA